MKAMSKKLYQELWLYINQKGERAKMKMGMLADTMANTADKPESIEFKAAVAQYRREREEAEYLGKLINKLEELEEKSDEAN